MDNKFLQIIGTQRSGSNLFRLMLNQLIEISAPHPPHILKKFFPLLKNYGNLAIDANFIALIDHVCKLVELNPVSWDETQLDRKAIFSKSKTRSLLEVFRLVYETNADAHGAYVWCCKSMANAHYFDAFEHSELNPLYIHLYRDGRDVALSFKKAIVGENHFYHIAKQWKFDQEKSIDIVKKVGPSRALQVSYEDLIHQPEMVMKKVCGFIGVKFDDNVFNYYRSSESKVTAKSGVMWSNLTRPVISTNSNKYKTEAAPQDIEIFEAVAGNVLLDLGYPLENPNAMNKEFEAAEILEFNFQNEEAKKKIIKLRKSDLDIRKNQEEFLKEIKNREFSYV